MGAETGGWEKDRALATGVTVPRGGECLQLVLRPPVLSKPKALPRQVMTCLGKGIPLKYVLPNGWARAHEMVLGAGRQRGKRKGEGGRRPWTREAGSGQSGCSLLPLFIRRLVTAPASQASLPSSRPPRLSPLQGPTLAPSTLGGTAHIREYCTAWNASLHRVQPGVASGRWHHGPLCCAAQGAWAGWLVAAGVVGRQALPCRRAVWRGSAQLLLCREQTTSRVLAWLVVSLHVSLDTAQLSPMGTGRARGSSWVRRHRQSVPEPSITRSPAGQAEQPTGDRYKHRTPRPA